MIRLENISLGYGGRTLFDDASLHLKAGEAVALVGRNGAGKSSLLRVITAIEKPHSGRVLLNGKDIAALSAEERARLVAFVGTERVRIANLRCEDVVAIGRAPYTNWMGRLQSSDRAIVAHALQAVGMLHFAERTIDTLSDGECQRIMIARALAQQTPVIILDEPTAFLDIPTRHQICRLLGELAHREGKCILYSTHDTDAALPVCDRVAIIEEQHLYDVAAKEANVRISALFGL